MTAGQGLARAGMVVSGAFLISRLLGYVRFVVIGNSGLLAGELDTFFAAFRLPDLIFQLVAAGALSSALIPVVSALLVGGEESHAWRVVSTVINLMLIALTVLAVSLFILAPVVMEAITPGFGPAQLDKTVELTRTMLLSPIFLALGAVATSVLNSRGRFAAAALAPIVYNLVIILAALVLVTPFGVEGLAIGVVLGSLGHLLVQIRPLARIGFRYSPRIDRRDPQARKALLLMAPRAIGLGATQITFIVVTALATTVGVGALADFNFAFALLQIPLGIIGVPLGIVVLPSLSRNAAVGEEASFATLLTRALRLLVYVMVPITALTVIVRQPVVEILFGSGKISQPNLDLIADFVLRDQLPYEDEGDTFFRGVHAVLPGHQLTVTARGSTSRRFWDFNPQDETRYRSYADYADRLRELVTQAVRRRLRTSGPAGLAVSGGLDSSVVFCIAHQLRERGTINIPLRPVWCVSEHSSASEEERFNGFPGCS